MSLALAVQMNGLGDWFAWVVTALATARRQLEQQRFGHHPPAWDSTPHAAAYENKLDQSKRRKTAK
jgi:hypothetical protein